MSNYKSFTESTSRQDQVDILREHFADELNLYIDDYLDSVAGKPMTEDELVQGLEDFAAHAGIRYRLGELVYSEVNDFLVNYTPAYLWPHIDGYIESLLREHDADEVYTSDQFLAHFMRHCWRDKVLEPTALEVIAARMQWNSGYHLEKINGQQMLTLHGDRIVNRNPDESLKGQGLERLTRWQGVSNVRRIGTELKDSQGYDVFAFKYEDCPLQCIIDEDGVILVAFDLNPSTKYPDTEYHKVS